MNFEERVNFCTKTDKGKVRPTNEDQFRVYDVTIPVVAEAKRGALFVVADGMGGHRAGEHASRLACEKMGDYFLELREGLYFHLDDEILDLLEKTIQDVNSAIYGESIQKPEFSGMGTTLTAVVIKGEKMFIGHVGDSRVYLFREGEFVKNLDRETSFLTEDQSEAAELVKLEKMTQEEAEASKLRNVLTQAVGSVEEVDVYTRVQKLMRGDLILMCTDGLYSMMSEEDIKGVLTEVALRGNRLQEYCDLLVERANEKGGKDNITVILLRI